MAFRLASKESDVRHTAQHKVCALSQYTVSTSNHSVRQQVTHPSGRVPIAVQLQSAAIQLGPERSVVLDHTGTVSTTTGRT